MRACAGCRVAHKAFAGVRGLPCLAHKDVAGLADVGWAVRSRPTCIFSSIRVEPINRTVVDLARITRPELSTSTARSVISSSLRSYPPPSRVRCRVRGRRPQPSVPVPPSGVLVLPPVPHPATPTGAARGELRNLPRLV